MRRVVQTIALGTLVYVGIWCLSATTYLAVEEDAQLTTVNSHSSPVSPPMRLYSP